MSQYGLGPAASKVYGVGARPLDRRLRRGLLQQPRRRHERRARTAPTRCAPCSTSATSSTRSIVFNSEIEFEHGTTSATKSSERRQRVRRVRDARLSSGRTGRTCAPGCVLVPMGFLNEIHEPPFYLGVHRPEVERRIIPSTWREIGAGLFGAIGEQIEYQLYVMNGLNAEGFDASGPARRPPERQPGARRGPRLRRPRRLDAAAGPAGRRLALRRQLRPGPEFDRDRRRRLP